MNIIDRAITALSPRLGLQRVAARSAIDALRVRNRYEAARLDRSLDGWLTTSASPNSEIGTQLQQIRNRSRDLGRNNPFVCRAYDLLASKMVGTGIRPRLGEGVSKQVRERTMALWDEWADTCDAEGLRDIYGLQYLVARTVVESGMALIRFEAVDITPNRRIPWVIRVLEPDYIDITQYGPVQETGGAVVLGVEYNARGQRVSYRMFRQHPGNDLVMGMNLNQTMIEVVPADRIAPVFYAERPEQTHGVPWCAPAVSYARNLDDLNDARLKRAKIQACYAAFIRKTPDSGQLTIESETGRRRQQLAPGIVEYLQPEEDVTMAVPPQGEGDDAWQIMLLHAIAAGIGVPYEMMTGDLRQVNYSSIRAGVLDFWALLDSWQHLMLEPMMCRPMWRRFDQIAAVRQNRNQPLDVKWDFPDRPFIDPLKDGQALDNALKAGRTTLSQIISESGQDPAAYFDELRREHTELKGLGLPHIQAPAPAQPSADQRAGLDPGSESPPNGSGMPAQEMMQ